MMLVFFFFRVYVALDKIDYMVEIAIMHLP